MKSNYSCPKISESRLKLLQLLPELVSHPVFTTEPNSAMAHKGENVCYGPLSLARHNLRDVAGLIYESAPEMFSLMFGTRAIACLTDLVQRSHNRFSHRYIRIAEIDHQVVGIVILVPAANLKDAADYQVFKFRQQLWLSTGR